MYVIGHFGSNLNYYVDNPFLRWAKRARSRRQSLLLTHIGRILSVPGLTGSTSTRATPNYALPQAALPDLSYSGILSRGF